MVECITLLSGEERASASRRRHQGVESAISWLYGRVEGRGVLRKWRGGAEEGKEALGREFGVRGSDRQGGGGVSASLQLSSSPPLSAL